jgi:epoxyqueuosine reductase
MDFVSKLSQTAQRFSFSHFGCVPLAKPLSLEIYRQWLEAGHQASMEYLERHYPLKTDPRNLSARARSAVVIAKSYFPHPYPSEKVPRGRTALYAAGLDYHTEFRRELEALAAALKADFPSEEFLCFTDSAPILERDLAAQAGLGWIGKNTCLIHPRKGSLFFVGEIFTSLDLAAGPMVPDFCGTCDRCIRACPTQAIERPRVLNSNKCIAYWTIEARSDAPPELRGKFGDWFFGCDICQTVCPWNEKVHGKEIMRKLSHPVQEPDGALVEDLRMILTSSNKSLSRMFAELPYSRARAAGLKRNALYVAGNLKLESLKPEVEHLSRDPAFADLAQWTLKRLNGTAPLEK